MFNVYSAFHVLIASRELYTPKVRFIVTTISLSKYRAENNVRMHACWISLAWA